MGHPLVRAAFYTREVGGGYYVGAGQGHPRPRLRTSLALRCLSGLLRRSPGILERPSLHTMDKQTDAAAAPGIALQCDFCGEVNPICHHYAASGCNCCVNCCGGACGRDDFLVGAAPGIAPRDHDAECERELTTHGYTPCRCLERAGICWCRKNPCECLSGIAPREPLQQRIDLSLRLGQALGKEFDGASLYEAASELMRRLGEAEHEIRTLRKRDEFLTTEVQKNGPLALNLMAERHRADAFERDNATLREQQAADEATIRRYQKMLDSADASVRELAASDAALRSTLIAMRDTLVRYDQNELNENPEHLYPTPHGQWVRFADINNALASLAEQNHD